MSRDPSLLPNGAHRDDARERGVGGTAHASDAAFHVPEHAPPPARPVRVPSNTDTPPVQPMPMPSRPPVVPESPPVPARASPVPVPPKPPAPRAPVAHGASGHAPNAPQSIPGPPLHMPPGVPPTGRAQRVTLLPEDRGSTRSVGFGWSIALIGVAIAVIGGSWAVLSRQIVAERIVVQKIEADQAALRDRVADVQATLQSYDATIRRARAARALLAQHQRWSTFFRTLEGRTLLRTTYQSLAVDVAGSVMLAATAPDVRSAMEQLVAYTGVPDIRQSESTSITNVVDEVGVIRGVQFDVRLEMDPAVFSRTDNVPE